MSFPTGDSYPTDDGTYTDAGWGPQDASHPKSGETATIDEVHSILGHICFRQGGPVAWGCTRKKGGPSRSSCKAEIFAADEGTKTTLGLRHLAEDLGLPEVASPTPLWNDNRGTVDWSLGCSVSKKLRHLNIRELAVRGAEAAGTINISHIDGKINVADLLTKEMKDDAQFQQLAMVSTSPLKVEDYLRERATGRMEGGDSSSTS